MQKLISYLMVLVIAGLVLSASFAQSARAETLEVVIQVSPSTLALDSQGVWVTVHAEIPLSQVAGYSVELNGIPVVYVKADSRGDLVCKFNLDDVKGIVAPPSAELTLKGMTKDGCEFIGTDIVGVK